jgi:hypothetical protein
LRNRGVESAIREQIGKQLLIHEMKDFNVRMALLGQAFHQSGESEHSVDHADALCGFLRCHAEFLCCYDRPSVEAGIA